MLKNRNTVCVCELNVCMSGRLTISRAARTHAVREVSNKKLQKRRKVGLLLTLPASLPCLLITGEAA